MNLHLQTGPGHHHNILIGELMSRKMNFTFSGYHPTYQFSQCRDGVITSQSGSKIYDAVKWFVWGISNKFSLLRKNNAHLDYTYALYDNETKKRIGKTDLLFAWAQVSLRSIQTVKGNGGVTILDYPIPHILTWQKALLGEANLLEINPYSIFTSRMEDRMLKEIEQADFVSVPSVFVQNSFIENGVHPDKLIFNSYGIDTSFFRPDEKRSDNDRLTVIFVGSVEIRKGVHYLLQAFDQIKDPQIELSIIGTIHKDVSEIFEKYKNRKNIFWLGQKTREQTANLMRSADVLVMPSLLEGLSLTILEAMACGTPVISSANAGGLDVITDFKEGFVVPVRDSAAIKDKLIWCSQNRTALKEMRSNARKKILNGYRQEDYVNRFMEKVISKGK